MKFTYTAIAMLILGYVNQPGSVFATGCGNTITIEYANDENGNATVSSAYVPDMDYMDCDGKWQKGYPGISGGSWDAHIDSPIIIGEWGSTDNVTPGQTVHAGENKFVCGHFTEDQYRNRYCKRVQ